MEHIRTPKVEQVRLLETRGSQSRRSLGTLYLSATHTIFIETQTETRSETWLLHSMVCGVDRPPSSPTGCQLVLRCKDFRVLHLLFLQERDCLDVHTSLARLSRPECYSELYCLSFNPNANQEERERSWAFVRPVHDYQRMGLPNNLWVATAANSEYQMCDSYPAQLFVPRWASPEAAVCRCSQPLSGFSGRSEEDEQMLTTLNAMANRAAGKGYENQDHYGNIKLHFSGIDNIHVMRSSQQRVLDVGEQRAPSMSDFLLGLESSGWLKHIKAPYYRTLQGLMVLIEKDWVSFGHKFSHRYGHLEGDPREVSPVLDQFLEVLWQLTQQFPCAFQEGSQQLEQELANQQERLAALTGEPISFQRVEVPRRKISHSQMRYSGPDPPTTYSYPITAQDRGSSRRTSEPANEKARRPGAGLCLPLEPPGSGKGRDPDDLSSDLESGVADLSAGDEVIRGRDIEEAGLSSD
ncbi:hypothetical protein CRUP_017379 [Coryphaenoides rupestris]|nr:hypothetical protein CRUP_017379 [Coryphaenoides rupestris]